MGDRDDELLVDPPMGDHHLGGLAGYRRGGRVRKLVFGSLIGSVLLAAASGYWYVQQLRAERRGKSPDYQLRADTVTDDRPRTLSWTSGQARLGLSREPPGVHTIELPDEIVELADGCDHAQIKVRVQDGKTVALQVVTGEIRRTPRETPPPTPPATAP